MNKERIINKVNNYLRKVPRIGKESIKITKEMFLAGLYLKKNGATFKDIQKFYKEEYSVNVTVIGIKKRFAAELKRGCLDLEAILGESNFFVKDDNLDKKKESKASGNVEIKSDKSDNENRKDSAIDEIKKEEIVVIDGIKYKRKEKVYSSGDLRIERRVDEIEKQMEDGGRSKYSFSSKDWANYTCRYEPKAELRKCILSNCDIKQAPDSVRGAYYSYVFKPKTDFKHLEEIK